MNKHLRIVKDNKNSMNKDNRATITLSPKIIVSFLNALRLSIVATSEYIQAKQINEERAKRGEKLLDLTKPRNLNSVVSKYTILGKDEIKLKNPNISEREARFISRKFFNTTYMLALKPNGLDSALISEDKPSNKANKALNAWKS